MFRPPMRKAFADGTRFGTTHGVPPWKVLALPGWMHTTVDFDATLGPLAAGSVAVDLPGFGGVHDAPPTPWSTDDYASWVEPVLADLDPPVVLVGHSFGGRVAVHLAARRPDAVSGLVLTGVPLLRRTDAPPAAPAVPFRVARWLNRRGLLPDARMEAMRKRYGSEDYRNASGVMRDILVKATNETYEEPLRRVRCPVQLVWGENDTAAPVSVAARASEILGERATLVVVEGAGHQLPLVAPEALRGAIERLL